MQGKVTKFLRKPPRLTLWASLVVMTSCVSLAEYERIKGRVVTLEAKQAEDDRTRSDEIAVVKQQCEFSTRQLSSRLDCNNNQVREFLKACEEGSDVCSDQGADNALAFMDSQPYVLMFLRSTLETQDLNSTRVGQIMTLSEAKTWRPSTRFLILVQPAGDTPVRHGEAVKAGEQIKLFLRNDMGIASKLEILGPKMLPCKLKADRLSHYKRKYDRPIRGEPTGKEPAILLWVFRTSC